MEEARGNTEYGSLKAVAGESRCSGSCCVILAQKEAETKAVLVCLDKCEGSSVRIRRKEVGRW